MKTKRLIVIFGFILTIFCFLENESFGNPINDSVRFSQLDKFINNKPVFTIDTFSIKSHSTEGGILNVYHSSDFDFIALEFWIYGEMGKTNLLFITDTDFKIIIAQSKQFEYDKPFYENDFKENVTCEIYTFDCNLPIGLYSCDRVKIEENNENLIRKGEELIETFNLLTSEIRIEK